ncbi:MAG: type II toxin-antitoxin system RelE/ParE family toxin [Patescibacteria group bacterium]|nr:type II toxin-antitoxin system RelE/ParE family toxin [Patescibacteria group bacterium]
MRFEIWYKRSVVDDDIPKLPKKAKGQIEVAIREKLTTHPERFGKPLRESLKGYRRLRGGDYRVIYRIEGENVKIFAIQKRSDVYRKVKIRILS